MTDKRETMIDFDNLVGTISTIAADVPRMEKQIDELKLEVLKLHMLVNGANEKQLELPDEMTTSRESDVIEQIETLVSQRIGRWLYASKDDFGVWRCPLVPSAVAEMLGDRARWQEVKTLIRHGGWDRLTWYYDRPPAGWKGGDPNSKGIQWVAVRND